MKNIPLLSIIIILVMTGCSEDTIEPVLKGNLTGKVISKSTGDTLENVKISTSPASSTAFTDSLGDFLIENIAVDTYSVQAELEGFTTGFESVTISEGETSNVAFELTTSSANNRQPTTPELLFPEDGATGIPLEVELAWDSTDPNGDDISYGISVRNGTTNEIFKFDVKRDTTLIISNLQLATNYFWQVSASDSINDPVQSAVYSFQTMEISRSRIVYVKKINGNNVIFTRDENDNEYQITSSNTNSFRPRKNNSTDKIAFLRTVGAQTQLFTMNLDGSQEFQVTSSIPVNGFNMDKVDFSWANDGASLVYPNFEKLYRIQATGGGNTLIYQAPSGRFITEVDVSEDNTLIALLTNNAQGYNASIYTINASGNIMDSVIAGLPGALGGIDISVDKKRLLFTRDVSGFESSTYRQLDSRLFIYDFGTNMSTDISKNKDEGTNDLDPRFSPNEAEIIFVNTSNDGVSESLIYKSFIRESQTQLGYERQELYQNAIMPDWE